MERKKYGYVETSNVLSAYGGAHLYSVQDDDNILENGMVVALGDPLSEEIYKVEDPKESGSVVLIADPVMFYDQSTSYGQSEIFYCVEAGVPARAYGLVKDDKFAIIDYLVTTVAGSGQPAVKGNLLVADTSTRKYTEKQSTESIDKYGFVAQIVDIIVKSGMTLYLVRVLKNADVAAE